MRVLTEELRLAAHELRKFGALDPSGRWNDETADLLERAADRIEDLEREAVTDTQPELPL